MLFILISTSLFVFLFHELYWKRRNFPPGPIPIPFVGNMLSMTRPNPGYECFQRWVKQYGDVFTFWLGSEPYVIIASYDRIKDTFIRDGDTYVDKKVQKFQEEFRGGNYGVIESNGALWRDHRRFALSNLRDFGLGKDLMQEKILIEVEEIFKQFDENPDEEHNVPKIMDSGVANVINQIIFGYRFEGEKLKLYQKLQELMEFQENVFKQFKVVLQVFIPFVSKFAEFLPGKSLNEEIADFKADMFNFFNSQIAEHRQKVDFSLEENADYAEAYLKEQKKREDSGDFESFNNQQFANMCLDIWFAGLSTSSITLSWTIAYIMNTEGVQEKIHEEMDRVIGSDRLVRTTDKNDLVYMTAVLNESQRCANILSLNVPHATTKDTVIGGFPVEKGTGVIAQISTVMLDESVFPDPYRFNPDRFIENGKLKKIEQLVPFSIGKRQCLGEGLARMELFLFIANLFNRYEICPSSGGLPSIDKTENFGVTPRKFTAILKRRKM